VASDKRWPVLVVSHVFSTFWLQALMMPAQMLSVPVFAASRAAEIPVAAALRGQVLGVRYGKRNMATLGQISASACIMFFSYAKLSGCACVWSGSGVALSGAAFWIISLLMLAMPATNAVCQETIMLQPGMHPLLLLALQNIFACVLVAPILVVCHLMGWEDVTGAFEMIVAYSEVFMLVLWLCAQMAATSVLTITLIHIVDSFWTIVLRALRVCFWAICVLSVYYLQGNGTALSIAVPWESFWSFVLLSGTLMGAAATYCDKAFVPEDGAVDKNDAAAATSKQAASGSAAP